MVTFKDSPHLAGDYAIGSNVGICSRMKLIKRDETKSEPIEDAF